MTGPDPPPGLPPVPVMNVGRVLDLRDRLADFLCGFLGERPVGDRFHGLVRGLVGELPQGTRVQAVSASAAHLAGQPVTAAEALALAWRLAANVDHLKANRTVLPQSWRHTTHWAALQIETVRPIVQYPEDKARRQRGSTCTFQALTGPAAGLRFRRFWTLDLIRFFATVAGFPKPWEDGAFDDERQIAGFRLAAYLEPERIRDDQPGFKQMKVTAGFETWNRALLAARDREKAPCVRRLPLTVACHTCPAGRAECPAGCHVATYTVGSCSRCGQRAYFDPDPDAFHADVCVGCARKIDLAQMRR